MEKLNIVELYQETMNDMESVLLGEKVLYEVFHREWNAEKQQFDKVQHQSQYVNILNPEQELLSYFEAHSIDPSTLEYRPFEHEEVTKMLKKLKKDLGLSKA